MFQVRRAKSARVLTKTLYKIMKKTYSIIILVLISTTSALAVKNDRFSIAMQEYLEITGSISTTKLVLENVLNMQAQNLRETLTDTNPKKVEVILGEIRSYYESNYLTEDYLINLYMPSFRERFKLKELQELILFYRTPIGQKLVKFQPKLQTETMNQLQADLRSGEPKLQKRIRARLKSEGLR